MTLLVAPEWHMDVEQGPNWLFVRLHGPGSGEAEGSELAEKIWMKMQQQFTKRLVLELDDLPVLRSAMIGELVKLYKRVVSTGGTIRLSGLSDNNQEALGICRLGSHFPHYKNREDAVMGPRREGTVCA